MKTLFILPTPISEEGVHHIPQFNIDILNEIKILIVERKRTARRFIRKVIPEYDFSNLDVIIEMDEIFDQVDLEVLKLLENADSSVGLMSEAGFPCIADPGARVVDYLRNKGYAIRPLSGPNSIMLSLAASGLNGQNFCFHGYLPVKKEKLKKELSRIDGEIRRTGYTQVFIETPYRNERLFDFIMNYVNDKVRLCVAIEVTSFSAESIRQKAVADWKKGKRMVLDKHPAIFLLGL